jgi:hypothetical protein
MESADAHQLGKTVDLLSKVHNVKQALIRIFPCLKHVFAPTLYDYIGNYLLWTFLHISNLLSDNSWDFVLRPFFTLVHCVIEKIGHNVKTLHRDVIMFS